MTHYFGIVRALELPHGRWRVDWQNGARLLWSPASGWGCVWGPLVPDASWNADLFSGKDWLERERADPALADKPPRYFKSMRQRHRRTH